MITIQGGYYSRVLLFREQENSMTMCSRKFLVTSSSTKHYTKLIHCLVIGSTPSQPFLYTSFSNCPSGPIVEVMSPATIKATNEPAPSCITQLYGVRKHAQIIPSKTIFFLILNFVPMCLLPMNENFNHRKYPIYPWSPTAPIPYLHGHQLHPQ